MRIARFVEIEDKEAEPRYGVLTEDDEIIVIDGDPLYTQIQPAGRKVSLSEVRLLAPVIPRSKVVGVGRNYTEHIDEMGYREDAQPVLFFKPNTSVIGPDDPILLPHQSENVHYEGELGVVIKTICKDVPRERAEEFIYGYVVANDVTARDIQQNPEHASTSGWAVAKGFDSFCPIGPWIETELDISDAQITTRLDGKVVQQGSTRQMILNPLDIVSYVSSFFTLLPGDIILTGTPAGVGRLGANQKVEVEIEGLGVLANPVIDVYSGRN